MEAEGSVHPAPSTISWLFRYHDWARPRLLEAARLVDPAALREAGRIPGGAGGTSLFGLVAHVAGAEETWLGRWLGDERAPLPGADDYRDLDEVESRWAAVAARRREWLGGLGPDDLLREVAYVSVTRRVRESFPLWKTLLHLSNHTTHHRAEACAALTGLGSPPRSVDLLDFIRAEAASGC